MGRWQDHNQNEKLGLTVMAMMIVLLPILLQMSVE